MQASEIKLQEIIEGTKQYLVPLFQRPYSWTKSEWQVLWDDLDELCNINDYRTHFMGTIVTMNTRSVPEGVTKYLLIDGQQRLTTVFILLAALRDRAKNSSEEELAEEINNTILINPYKKGLDKYKLQPTQLDRKEFHQIIDNQSPINDSDLLSCYHFFEKKIKQSSLDLSKIKKVICNSFSLISVVLGKDDDPYLVFESLNAKGRPLTQADLIRNYFFMGIHTEEQESVYNQYWLPMQKRLGENLTEFIRHYLTKSGVEVRQNQIYFEIKEQINGQDVLGYLKDLYSFYEYYARFLDPTLEPNENIRKYLDRLHRLDVTIIYPFLLNCYDDYQQAQITEHDFIAVMKILENFILRRFVCNIQTRGLNRIFALLYSQVSKDTNLASESFVNRLKLTLQTRNYPKDPEFQSQLMAVNLYTGNRSQKARLILEAIEEFFKHKEKVVFDNLSIEHIMPQTLNKWWQEHLGTDYNATHQSLVHSLGNLTLTGYNSELSNDDFLSKRTRFVKSHLELNKYFGSQESWRQENIEARGKYLAEIALQIWGYFGDESAPSPQLINSMKGKTPKLLTILGEEFTVKSWRDVLEMTLNKIAEIDPEGFDNILAQFPRFIGWDKKDFRNTRQLKNGAFMEVNLSANDIYILCLKLIETTKLSREDWHIEAILK